MSGEEFKFNSLDTTNNLFNLIKNHEWDKFSELVKKDDMVDLNIRDKNHNYLITYAVLFNKYDVVKLLVERECSIDVQDFEGRSLLYTTIKYNYMKMLKLLLEANKNNIGVSIVDLKDKKGYVAIHYAILAKSEEAIKLLLEYGSNVTTYNGFNSLHLAIYSREYKFCKMVIDHGININAQAQTGESALHIACNLQLANITKLLLDNKIDPNLLDIENEFCALSYSVTLNDINIVKILFQYDLDANIQDYYGNSPLHYAIIEDNWTIFEFIINQTKIPIDYNIYNADSHTPLHILFMKNRDADVSQHISKIIDSCVVNIQDNTGNTALHYIAMDGLWKVFDKQLEKKTLDIFVKNKNDERVIDLIQKQELAQFLTMTANSYMHVLKTKNKNWEHDWEHKCKVTGNNSKTKECQKIIIKYLRDRIKDDTVKRESYPLPKNLRCEIVSGKEVNVDLSTFTGITLDVLVGLIYLLEKYPFTCTSLNMDFMENEGICNYYRSLGIEIDHRCEYLNFEIIWAFHKLHFSTNFTENIQKCLKSKPKKRYVIIPIAIILKKGSHANYLIIDMQKNELERFEPNGANPPHKFHYNPMFLDNILKKKFQEMIPDLKYFAPHTFLPKIGFQLMDSYENNERKIGDPNGFCAIWSIWYVDMRMKHNALPRDKLVKIMISDIKKKNVPFKNLIRNYSIEIVSERDKLLKLAKLDINDWLNSKFSDEQLLTINNALKERIQKVI
jgi:ankyrin repeat protein